MAASPPAAALMMRYDSFSPCVVYATLRFFARCHTLRHTKPIQRDRLRHAAAELYAMLPAMLTLSHAFFDAAVLLLILTSRCVCYALTPCHDATRRVMFFDA